MKLLKNRRSPGFTLVEMMVSLSCGSLMLAAVMTAGVALQRSFLAVEGYSISEGDQLRVQDYIAMDCRRSSTVAIANNVLTLTLPNYYQGNGTPYSASSTTADQSIQYGGRSLSDASITSGSANLTSATGAFTSADLGKSVTGSNIPSGTTVSTVSSSTAIVMSASATATASGATVRIGSAATISYYQSGTSFIRNVNGVEKAIATNVSNFTVSPQDLTSSVSCTITFAPRFVYLPGPGPINGTTVYSNTFLRNASARN
jgi:prepilin-type N-terminal cleavage/methylation domain-containing protein